MKFCAMLSESFLMWFCSLKWLSKGSAALGISSGMASCSQNREHSFPAPLPLFFALGCRRTSCEGRGASGCSGQSRHMELKRDPGRMQFVWKARGHSRHLVNSAVSAFP